MDISNKQLIELYIATFGRAPDASGLAFWLGHLSSGTLSLEQIANQFFDATETKERYPSTLSYSTFVDEVYTNVLNRPAEAGGKSYWVDRLEKGSITKDGFILAFVQIASANEGTSDQRLVSNKTEIGYYYASTLALNDTTLAFHAMDAISSDDNSLLRAKADLDAYKASSSSFIYKQLDALNNTYNATLLKDWIYGMDGDDTIDASDGANYAYGGNGNDTLYGGKDADYLYGDAGDDILYAGDGKDFLYGGEGNDSLNGEKGNNVLYGDAGDDYLYGGDDGDTLYGGSGNDTIVAGIKIDRIYGEEGDDFINASAGVNWVDGGTGNDTIHGGADADTLYGGSDNDTLLGFAAIDNLFGMAGNDTLYGGEGDDNVNGGEGDDFLYGDEGADKLYGETGNDTFNGGLGADTLTGGSGRDTFVFNQLNSTLATMDTVADFTFSLTTGDYLRFEDHGTETIVSAKVSTTSATSLATALDLAATNDGSTNAYLTWCVYQNNTYVVEDMSALATYDATTDLVVKLQGVYDLSSMTSEMVSFM